MTHARSQIRSAAAAVLTGLPLTGSRVYEARVLPMGAAELPALLVFTDSETSQRASVGAAAILQRELQLVVVGVAQANDVLEETLDALAEAVETALSDATFGGLAKGAELGETTTEIGGDGDRLLGAIRLTFNVLYMTGWAAPSVAK